MQTRRLGKTGYEVSEIGLGCWQLGGEFGPVGDDTAIEILRGARALDVTFWDTADVYGASAASATGRASMSRPKWGAARSSPA